MFAACVATHRTDMFVAPCCSSCPVLPRRRRPLLVVGLAHFQNVILQPLASVAKIPRYSGTALRWQLSTAAYIATFCGLRASPLHERWIRPFEFGAYVDACDGGVWADAAAS